MTEQPILSLSLLGAEDHTGPSILVQLHLP